MRAQTNVPLELEAGDATDVTFVGPGGRLCVPTFDGRVRFAAPTPGRYASSTGEDINVEPYEGTNPLYRHGRLRVAAGGRTLEHADGTPFLWTGDTWWMGLSGRLPWPEGFQMLTKDRVDKGFNVIQIVAGPLPEFSPTPDGIWHRQQANENGWPWDRDWARLNPDYYDAADVRIQHLVDSGLMPCIVGMWGFYLPLMGVERVKEHWRNLVARYAAYPVVFCLCGEGNLPPHPGDDPPAAVAAQRSGWTEVGKYVGGIDPYRNVRTIHPGSPDSRTIVDDEAAIDLNMLQTSHWSYHHPDPAFLKRVQDVLALDALPEFGLDGALSIEVRAIRKTPPMPVVNGEPAYEGIMGTNWQDVQRFLYWTAMLSGAAGHTYGAQGIWQMNSLDEPFSATGGSWGHGFWQEAMHYPGGRQVALGRRLFERYAWWDFAPFEHDIAAQAGRRWTFGAGMPGEVAVYFLGSQAIDTSLQGMANLPIPMDGPGHAFFFDPRTGQDIDCGTVQSGWIAPKPTKRDWVVVIETLK